MTEESKLQIRLHIYDTELPVRIPRSEEEVYRKAGKRINETINAYADVYSASLASGTKSLKDVLYMALVDITVRLEKEAKRNDAAPVYDILEKITAEIEQTLK